MCGTRGIAATVACLLWVAPVAEAASLGKLKICKKDQAKDYDDQSFWRKKVVVPAGAIFQDVGPVDDIHAPHIKLRVVTLGSASLSGAEKCKVVPAAIAADTGDWGTSLEGPVITEIKPSDNRLLEILAWGKGSAPKDLAPWGDVVSVEATIESPMR